MASAHHIQESVSIDRPPAEAWTAIADYPFDLQWRRGITEMTPDPPGPSRAVVIVSRSGRRLFIELEPDEVQRTNVGFFIYGRGIFPF